MVIRSIVLAALVTVVAVVESSAQQPTPARGAAGAGSSAASAAARRSAEALKPGQALKECRNCPEMAVVPAGSFMMGSPADEPERRDNERHHPISIPRPFAIGRTEVTWDQWEACVRDRWCDGPGVEQALRTNADGTPNRAFVDWGRGSRPVVGVSWFDAQNFVGWLNWKTGGDDAYRLPSEAEWEYAARAGTATPYPWGRTLDHNYGNFGGSGPGLGGKAEGRDAWEDRTAPVASFPPNAFGLHDMHGNVFEWVEDCYEADRAHAPADASPNKEGNCANRVFRGGTFLSNPYMQRYGAPRRAVPGDAAWAELPRLPGREDPELTLLVLRDPLELRRVRRCQTARAAKCRIGGRRGRVHQAREARRRNTGNQARALNPALPGQGAYSREE